MRVRSEFELQQNDSIRSGQHTDRTREEPNTSTSKDGPVYSRESTVRGYGKSKMNGHMKITNGVDDVICSKPSQDKRARKVGSDITHGEFDLNLNCNRTVLLGVASMLTVQRKSLILPQAELSVFQGEYCTWIWQIKTEWAHQEHKWC